MIDFFYDSCLMFFRFLIPGIFLGIIYDVFRLIRIGRNDQTYRISKEIKKRYFPKKEKPEGNKQKKRSKKIDPDMIFIFLEDICFFLIVAVTEILAIYYLNNGEIRIYCLIFSAVGFFAYQKTIGKLIIFLSRKIIYLVRKTICFAICIFLTPAFFMLRKVQHLRNSKNMRTKTSENVK